MSEESDILQCRNCVFRMHVHLVFVTRYRRDVFTKEAMVLVNYPPKVAVSALVNSLKSVSSRMIG